MTMFEVSFYVGQSYILYVVLLQGVVVILYTKIFILSWWLELNLTRQVTVAPLLNYHYRREST